MSSKLIAIVGPTASGKSELALQIAQHWDGEIICADSRTVYRGMDIGTAKPSPAEQKTVPHHLLDLVEPSQTFSAQQFKNLALAEVDEVISRGKLPILVGGTGLYIDAVLYDYSFAPASAKDLREELNQLSVQELQSRVSGMGAELNESDYSNPRRLIRAIETQGSPRSKKPLRKDTFIIGLAPGPSLLHERIKKRVDEMVENGFVDEVREIINKYSLDAPGVSGIGYRAFADYITGQKTLDQAKADFVSGDTQLAKRQVTWFKRNKDIHWASSASEGLKLCEQFLKGEV